MTDSEDSPPMDVLVDRAAVLERLVEGPGHVRDLVDDTGRSRSTVNRAVNDLEDAALVERTGKGYAATTAGRFALEGLADFRAALSDVVAAEPVTNPLGADAALDRAAVVGGTVTLATDPNPYRALEPFHDDVADATRYRALLPALDDPRHVRLLYEHVVTDDRPADLVVSGDLLSALRAEFPRRAAAMADSEEFTLSVGDVPPFLLALVDREQGGQAVHVVVFNDSGGVHGTVANERDEAVRWAETRLEEATATAEVRTNALRADADGGVAPASEGGAATVGADDALPVALEREGFVRLDPTYFREEPVADPVTAWRAGLTITEVHTGYAVDRAMPPGDEGDGSGGDEDDDGGSEGDDRDPESIAASLAADLVAGQDRILVGPPGSGKSTVCKQVACEWYREDRGPVLYREQGTGRPFDAVDAMVAAVDAADGHALVVVEDAVRAEAAAAFDALERFGDRDDVSVLLDAREQEWNDPPAEVPDVDALGVRTVPPLSDRGYERLVEQFERTVGEDVDVPVDALREEVRAVTHEDSPRGEVLLLLHRLASYADPLAEGRTTLDEDVAAVHRDLAGDDVALDVCVLANLLNAAGLGAGAGALYAAADPDDYAAVDAAVERLEGRVLFSREDGTYRTVHETWSVSFLAHLVDADGEDAAAERFGRCVSRLLGLADDPQRRSAIVGHLDDERTVAAVTDDPAEWAERTATAVYELGRQRPKLAPLFGDGTTDSVALPDAAPAGLADRCLATKARMLREAGAFDAARRAYERLPDDDGEAGLERLLGLADVAYRQGDLDESEGFVEACLDRLDGRDRPRARARANLTAARVAKKRTDTETARRGYEDAVEGFEAAGDRRGVVEATTGLGHVSRRTGDVDEARTHFEHNLEAARELGDRTTIGNAHRDLALALHHEGDLETAREHYERSVEIHGEIGTHQAVTFRKLGHTLEQSGEYDRARECYEHALEQYRAAGDRAGAAATLGNRGLLDARLGAYDRARERIEESLEAERDIGDRRAVACRLNNLGLIGVRQGNHERARERFGDGLSVARDVDAPLREVNANNGLGHVHRLQGRWRAAADHHETALDLVREIGHQRREADSRNKLGHAARVRGRYEEARTHHEAALDLAREIDNPREHAEALMGIGLAARGEGRLADATDHLAEARAVVDDVDNRIETGHVRLATARVAMDRGDVTTAREHGEAVREAFAAIGANQWLGRAHRLLGRVAAAEGDDAAAIDHWRTALEAARDVEAPQDALAVLAHLLDADDAVGDHDEDWARRTRAVLADAPPEVVDHHRTLVAGVHDLG